jgi:AraC-like DNA-binding protein
MYREQLSVESAAPREWTGWASLIDQGLASRGCSLAESPLAARLLRRSANADSMDQATCSILWNEALLLSADPLLGLNLCQSDSQLPLPLQVLGLTAAASLTMGSAISSLVRFFSLISTQATLELRIADHEARLFLHPRGRPHPQQMAALAGIVGSMLVRFASRCLSEPPRLVLGLPGIQRDERLPSWCARLEHSETCWILVPRDWMEWSLPDAAPGLVSGMTGVLHGVLAGMPDADLVERVRHAIQLHLARGRVGEEQIAGPMKISPRHLRRLLRQHNTSYEQLLDEVRRETALRLLAEERSSLTSIAYELGFHDPSSFTRAFRRWTGYSPSDFRRRQAG